MTTKQAAPQSSPDEFRQALAHVCQHGISDVLARPFELDLLHIPAIAEETVGLAKTACQVQPALRIPLPKPDLFEWRCATLLEPVDVLRYHALVLRLLPQIDSHLAGSEVVFSRRWSAEGDFKHVSPDTFKSVTSARVKFPDVNWLVMADVANLGEQVDLSRLLDRLLEWSGHTDIVDQLSQALRYWAPDEARGLPVGPSASLILNEAALQPVDSDLLALGLDFTRYVDDYRLFTSSLKRATGALYQLQQALRREGFFVRPSKTRLEQVSGHAPETPAPALCMSQTLTIPPQLDKVSVVDEPLPGVWSEALDALLKISRGDAVDLARVVRIAQAIPQLAQIVVEALREATDSMGVAARQRIKELIDEALAGGTTLHPFAAATFIRFLRRQSEGTEDILLSVAKNPRHDSYVRRLAIEGLWPGSAKTASVLREGFRDHSTWEQRAAAVVIWNGLAVSQRSSWRATVERNGSAPGPLLSACIHYPTEAALALESTNQSTGTDLG